MGTEKDEEPVPKEEAEPKKKIAPKVETGKIAKEEVKSEKNIAPKVEIGKIAKEEAEPEKKIAPKVKIEKKAKEVTAAKTTKNKDAKLETNEKLEITDEVEEVKKEEASGKEGEDLKVAKPEGDGGPLEKALEKHPNVLILENSELHPKPVMAIIDVDEIDSPNDKDKHVHHHLTGGAITTFLITIFIFQFILCIWKKRHRKSFFVVTLAGLWLFPAFIFFQLLWWRFIIVWTLASISLLTLAYKATRKPLAPGTPRAVYSFFVAVHKVTSWMSIGGYAILMIEIFGLGLIIGMELADFGIMLIGYGIYFGVLSRDWAEVCSSYISTTIGYFSKDGTLPRRSCRFNYCAVCDRELHPSRLNTRRDQNRRDQRNLQEKTFKMNCGHICHDFCIRGWVMIGKVDTCPVCREKVNISDLFVTPWQKQEKAWANVLDAVRYMVVWNPIIIAVGRFMIYEMGIPMLIEHHVGRRPLGHIHTIKTH